MVLSYTLLVNKSYMFAAWTYPSRHLCTWTSQIILLKKHYTNWKYLKWQYGMVDDDGEDNEEPPKLDYDIQQPIL